MVAKMAVNISESLMSHMLSCSNRTLSQPRTAKEKDLLCLVLQVLLSPKSWVNNLGMFVYRNERA